jgi:quercetin dioxygenase-like cupin family protein
MLANASASESVDDRVRRRLRELRSGQGLTLQQVAERAHLDVSTLSRLESGKRRITLDHLPVLAEALGVTTDDLIGATHHPDPRVAGKPIRRDQLTMWPLTHRSPGGGGQAYRVVISARRNRPPKTLPIHDGHDWMYIVSGRMRLMLGDDDLIIEPGEAVEFVTTTPHWFGAVDGPVELIAIFGPHGERSHVHT